MENNAIIDKIYEMLDKIPVTPDNAGLITEIKQDLSENNLTGALQKVNQLTTKKNQSQNQEMIRKIEKDVKEDEGVYPKKLSDPELERKYIGLLLDDPKYIVKFYFLFSECFFEDEELLNIYKSVLYTEGASYTPEIAKDGFNFARDTESSYNLKYKLI